MPPSASPESRPPEAPEPSPRSAQSAQSAQSNGAARSDEPAVGPDGAKGTGAAAVGDPGLRALLLRAAFATVAGATVADQAVRAWPAAGWQSHAIGFAAWAHRTPDTTTVYYVAMLLAALGVWALAPRLQRLQRRYLAWRLGPARAAQAEHGRANLAWIGWLWAPAALALPWMSASAGALLAAISLTWWVAAEVQAAAGDPARVARGRVGLSVAAIGYGAGLTALDVFPAATPGMLAWYNPTVAGLVTMLTVGLWALLARRGRAAAAGGNSSASGTAGADGAAGALRAGWWLLPLGALPMWGAAVLSARSPWGDPAIGPAHFAAAWAILAAAASAVLIGMARRGLAQAAEANAAERFVDRVAWVIWPLILFDMVYERNLRMVGFSAQGIPFDFMHWGEWWAPWEALQHGGRLWVNVFPIHGVGNDIGPCSMAAWLGDASLSGRFQVDAVLNAVMFVLFYWGLLKISRLRSVALLGVLMIVWEEPSWFKTWLADSRYLMLFAWALAALAVGDRLSRAAAGSSRGATGLRAAALLLGLLPLVCFLDSVDVGYVTLVATAGLAALLILWPARFSAEAALARGAGWIAAAALLGSCGVFLVGLGDRLPTFWAYHWAVFRDKGWFDFLPLGFSDAYSAVKVLYIVATPVAVGGTVLAVLRGAGSGAAPASDPTVSEGRWAFGPLAVAGAAFLYFKKGLDRTDTAHFEQAAILTPLLVAYLLAVLQRRCCFRRAESGGAIRESGNLAVSSVGALVGAPGALASAPGSWTGAPGAPAGLALALGAGLLCWVGITQQVVSLASHPARPQIWGLVEPHPKTNLPDCPRAGTLRCIGEQAEPVDATLAWLRSNTAPGEPVYDFTNSNLWSFLADRPNPTRFAQSFHALDDGFQREAVADLKRHPPVAVLFPSGPTGVDHVDLTLRQHWISAWLLQHYAPALHVGYYLVLLPIDPAWRSVRYRPPPPGFSAEDFLGEQDQGFVPRAFAAAPPVALGPPQETVAPGGSTAAAEPLRLYGLTPDGDLAQAWRFQTTEPRARVILPLPRPIDPRTAGWLDLDLSVSAGTYAAVDFLTAAQVAALDPHTPPEALHRVDFRLIPARHTGLVTTYRFHLAALPNWMFRRDPIVALDLTPTDESYIQVHIAAVRFYPDASLAPPAAPGESAP